MPERAASDPWFVCTRPRSSPDLRLFCFPYAGGGASIYRAWPTRLTTNLEVFAVQLPGRESRLSEAPFDSLPRLVTALADVIAPYTNGRYAFFGHSFGALLGFELARELRKRSHGMPVCLFASGRQAPRRPEPDPPLHRLPDTEFARAVHRRYNAIPQFVFDEPELLQLLLPALRADLSMAETYAYSDEAPLDCTICAFGGELDHRLTKADLDAWRDETCGESSVRMFPGDHFFLQHVQAQVLNAVSEEVQSRLASS